MPSDGFIGEKQLLGVVFLGELLFVGYEVVDARVTILANHQAALVHFLFAKAISVALFSMHPSGDEVMLRHVLMTTT
jgi:hypothetical protein